VKEGEIPLHNLNEMNFGCAQLLVANKADVNAEDNFKRTPLHRATWFGKPPFLKLLIENNANVNCQDIFKTTPLHLVAKEGNKVCAEILINSGANKKLVDLKGQTPYDGALTSDQFEMSDILQTGLSWRKMMIESGIPPENAEKYEKLFKEHAMDETIISELDHSVLKDIGITLVGDRLKILKKVKQLLSEDDSHSSSLDDIVIGAALSSGCFGEVFKGMWQGTTHVALKRLHDDKVNEFKAEEKILTKLQHTNIVQYLGVYNKNAEKYIVMEYLPLGSLDSVLQKDNRSIPVNQILEMAKDASSGILYLHSRNVLHRDIACRNLLVKKENERYVVKVADFGLSRSLYNNSYYVSETAVFARKWAAPEIIQYNKYSVASDVYALGITFWEMLEFGKIPYPEFSNTEAIKKVLEGERPARPTNCPDTVWTLMQGCWHQEVAERPNLKDVHQTLLWSLEDSQPSNDNEDEVSANLGAYDFWDERIL